jgi:UDP-N-acetylmuramate: L-alanyl-gamma-D-glutamyl-meso-diaminopimelate ligase
MILHILRKNNYDFDYMVGASLAGFDISVRLSEEAPVMVLEGDEYPDSTINKIPKFHLYHPDIALLSGIAWDHINIFPTFENYVSQFKTFVELIPESGILIFNSDDPVVAEIASSVNGIRKIPYAAPRFEIINGISYLVRNEEKIPLKIFGKHNLQNAMGAIEVCKAIGLAEADCIEAIMDFTGASRRLELLGRNDQAAVFKDFAHSPSKLLATLSAVKEQFPQRKLVACLELHTYSSLNKDFLREYRGGMRDADVKIIFYNNHTLQIKGMPPLDPVLIRKSFEDETIEVFTNKNDLQKFLQSQSWNNSNLLLMSSGNFGGLDLKELTTFVTTHL